MLFNSILSETAPSGNKEYGVMLINPDGYAYSGFSVDASTKTDAYKLARKRAHSMDTVKVSEITTTQVLDQIRLEIQRVIDWNPVLKASPSMKKGYERKLKVASTTKEMFKLLNKVSNELKVKLVAERTEPLDSMFTKDYDDVLGVLYSVTKQMEAAKKGLGLSNKLKSEADRAKHRSQVMSNMNVIRGKLSKITKDIETRIENYKEALGS